MFQRIFLFSILLSIVLFSCRREDAFFEDSSARLNFSTDSITFDTVFTTVGSITENFKVYNPYKESIKISSIRLNGGDQSTFRINVDGMPGPTHKDIEIAPEDSIWIFVEATVDPDDETKPFVIEDQIEFITNGNTQEVRLVAWGQNAIYYTPTTFRENFPPYSCMTGQNNTSGPCSDSILPVNVTWTDNLPYVVYGFVVVDSLDKLTIEKNTKIYFHNNGGLWVTQGGQLTVNGAKDEPVVFQNDRLEMRYDNVPGQWDRIWINDGGDHEINYAIIKNAFIGLQVESFPFEDPIPGADFVSLKLKNTVIKNCSGFGLLTNLSDIEAENLVIQDCGQYNVAIQAAGDYSFTHCTFANYFDQGSRETPLFFIQNSYINALRTQIGGVPNVDVYNSIIDGSLDSEFEFEIIKLSEDLDTLDLDFRNTILKTEKSISNTSQFKNIILNPTNRVFEDRSNSNYELAGNSVAKDKGDIIFGNAVPFDLNGESRTSDVSPDLGAYEIQP